MVYTVFAAEHNWKCEGVQGVMHCSFGAEMTLGIFRHAACIQYTVDTCCTLITQKTLILGHRIPCTGDSLNTQTVLPPFTYSVMAITWILRQVSWSCHRA